MEMKLEVPDKKMWKKVMLKSNGIRKFRDLVNEAITLFEKVIDERNDKKIIVSVDEEEIASTGIEYKEICMSTFPPLDSPKKKHKI